MVTETKYPLFSILVANYNNGEFFNDCYNSIVEQTYTHWEVIIVDDGSTDNSVELIKECIGDDNRFKLFQEEKNKGCGFAKRKCVELATGVILGFLDPDDALHSNALQVMIDAHDRNQDASLISSKYEKYDEFLNFVEKGKHGSDVPLDKSYLTFGKGAITAFASFKRSHYLKTTGINLKLKRAIDQDLYFKLEEQGNTVFINKYLYKYRFHKASISQGQNEFKAQYWRFKTIIDAYKRRKQLDLKKDNLTLKEVSFLKSNYYISRLKRAGDNNKYCVKYYFLIKTILAYPTHKWRYKLKAFLLYNYYLF